MLIEHERIIYLITLIIICPSCVPILNKNQFIASCYKIRLCFTKDSSENGVSFPVSAHSNSFKSFILSKFHCNIEIFFHQYHLAFIISFVIFSAFAIAFFNIYLFQSNCSRYQKKCQAIISYVTKDTLLFLEKGVYYSWMPAYAPDRKGVYYGKSKETSVRKLAGSGIHR